MTFAEISELLKVIFGTPTALVIAVGMGMLIQKRIATKDDLDAHKKEVDKRVTLVEGAVDGNGAMMAGGLKRVEDEIRNGLRRLDASQTEHHGVMYGKIDRINEKVEVVQMNVAKIEGACRACDVGKAVGS